MKKKWGEEGENSMCHFNNDKHLHTAFRPWFMCKNRLIDKSQISCMMIFITYRLDVKRKGDRVEGNDK